MTPPGHERTPGSPPRSYQRRTLLVKRSLQLKYITLVFASVLVAVLIVAGDVYYTLASGILLDNPTLAPLMAKVNHLILVKMIIYFGIVMILSAIVSHRMAGPVYRFEQSARRVSEGDLSHRVGLRGGDELLELQEAFNRMIASLQTKVQKDRHLAERIAGRIEELARKAPDPASAGELRALKKEIEHLTSDFKV